MDTSKALSMKGRVTNMTDTTTRKRTLRVHLMLGGQPYEHRIQLHPSLEGGMNPVESETTLMVYGVNLARPDLGPRWHYFPRVNVETYYLEAYHECS